MFEYLEFTRVPGTRKDKDLIMLALSTCGFCRRAKEFLAEHQVEYRYVDVDSLDPEIKKQIRADFTEKFKKIITFPALIMDGEDMLTGFIKPSWVDHLGLGEKG